MIVQEDGLHVLSLDEVFNIRATNFKQESTIPFGGPYDWHDLDGRLTLVRRPDRVAAMTRSLEMP